MSVACCGVKWNVNEFSCIRMLLPWGMRLDGFSSSPNKSKNGSFLNLTSGCTGIDAGCCNDGIPDICNTFCGYVGYDEYTGFVVLCSWQIRNIICCFKDVIVLKFNICLRNVRHCWYSNSQGSGKRDWLEMSGVIVARKPGELVANPSPQLVPATVVDSSPGHALAWRIRTMKIKTISDCL